jgi:hypothetical protein
MMLPGLLSVAFYRRRPTGAQVAIGVVSTGILSGVLGAILPPGALGRTGSIVLAVVGGILLFVAILLFLVYVYQPIRAQRTGAGRPEAPP